MGWGTDFQADIYLSKQVYYTTWELEEEIAEKEDEIASGNEQLLMLAMANPKDLTPNDEDIIYSIRSRVKDIIEMITEASVERYKLELYKKAIEAGKAKLSKRETIEDYNNDLC